MSRPIGDPAHQRPGTPPQGAASVPQAAFSLDATALRDRLDIRVAIAAIRQAARGGIAPVGARVATEVSSGQLLYMPAEMGGYVGCKLLSVAPGNPARGLDRIQGVFMLFDAETLALRGTIDGAELTLLRTAAVSAAFADLAADPERPARQ